MFITHNLFIYTQDLCIKAQVLCTHIPKKVKKNLTTETYKIDLLKT